MVARQHLKNDKDIEILNKLICGGEELLYSAFEVFESDPDQDDLLDTIIRIINNYKEAEGVDDRPNLAEFYNGKQKQNERKKNSETENKIQLIQTEGHKKRGRQAKPQIEQKQSLPLGEGYFFNKIKERQGSHQYQDTIGNFEAMDSLKQRAVLIKIIESFKSRGELNSFADEEYGTLFWLLEKEDQRLFETYMACRDTFDRQGFIEKIKELSRNTFHERFSEEFQNEDLALINQKRAEPNSLVSHLHQVFLDFLKLPCELLTL